MVTIRAKANVTLGGVFVGFGHEGEVPDGPETRAAAEIGLILIRGDDGEFAEPPIQTRRCCGG